MAGEVDRSGWPTVPGYELIDVLGRGGFATVYRATQASVDRPVALKVLASGALDPTTERRFRHEVRAVGALSDHPHVVALIDAGTTTAGAPFISMQLVPDGSFGDRVRASGALPVPEVARVGAEVADALDAAHEVGILHRDIKPDNILVGRRGRALLTDFGIATLDGGTMTATGTITGTLAYTPPEVVKGDRPSPATDVFALGATLYTLVAGRAAFSRGDEHVATVIYRVTTEDPPPLPGSVPPALADLVLACLAKDPAERPDLDEVRDRLALLAKPSPPTLLTPAPAPRPPGAASTSPPASTTPPEPSPPPPPEPPTVAIDAEAPGGTPADAATVAAAPAPEATLVQAPPPVAAPPPAAAGPPASPPPPAAPPPSSAPARRSRLALGVAAVVVVAALVAVAGVVLLGEGDEARPTEALTITPGNAPAAVLAVDDGVWVANRGDATVVLVDDDGTVGEPVAVGAGPASLAEGGGDIWVANADDSTFSRVDPDSGEVVSSGPVGEVPGSMSASADSVWMANAGDLDVNSVGFASNEYEFELSGLPGSGIALSATDDDVWVTVAGDDGSNIVVRVDAGDGTEQARLDLADQPSGIAATDDDVYVALARGGVARIDPASNEVVGTIEVEGSTELGGALAVDGEVWVVDLTGTRLVRLEGHAVVETVDVGVRTTAFTVVDGAAWVVDPDQGTVSRIPR